MFSTACSIAQKYTFPIVISYRHNNGECKCGMGAFVVINDEGWAVTAAHIISQITALNTRKIEYKQLVDKRTKIEQDTSLKKHVQMRELSKLNIPKEAITNFSIYLSGLGSLGQIHILPEVDLAVFNINNFDSTKVTLYPSFKDATKPMLPGTSLCKLGFPFHSITPTFDASTNNFQLPPGALPAPLFPIEGIFTRVVSVEANPAPAFPYSYIETSTPGLKGQSGGPTFDVHGNIWAIQSQTKSYKLGFGDHIKKTRETEHLQNQYLNVGWGVHAVTITKFLESKGIKFLTSHN